MIAALIDQSTGRIQAFTMPANEGDLQEGSLVGGLLVKWDTNNLFEDNQNSSQELYYYNGEDFVEKTEAPSVWHVYDWSAHTWSYDTAGFWNAVRTDRDLRLAVSDWTQNADSPLTDEKKAEWVTYRASLRNVPAANSSAIALDNIAWPTQPS
jgi:hypothetical protein|tara:strand:- start:434 stop:892 length:459 start_codon:yes stop_codon:yes gene_type:complete